MKEKRTEGYSNEAKLKTKDDGLYVCANCETPLFFPDVEFDSKTGWPSFNLAISGSINYKKSENQEDEKLDVECANCECLLGWVLDDGPISTTKRNYLNSINNHKNKEVE